MNYESTQYPNFDFQELVSTPSQTTKCHYDIRQSKNKEYQFFDMKYDHKNPQYNNNQQPTYILTRSDVQCFVDQLNYHDISCSEHKQQILSWFKYFLVSLNDKTLTQNTNLIMQSNLYKQILKYTHNLSQTLITTNWPNHQKTTTKILENSLMLITNLCRTTENIKLIVQQNIFGIIDKCLGFCKIKEIKCKALLLIGDLVSENIKEVKIRILKNQYFQYFYREEIVEFWEEECGKFHEEAFWVLMNVFRYGLEGVQEKDKEEIVRSYLPIFKVLLEIAHNPKTVVEKYRKRICSNRLKPLKQQNQSKQKQYQRSRQKKPKQLTTPPQIRTTPPKNPNKTPQKILLKITHHLKQNQQSRTLKQLYITIHYASYLKNLQFFHNLHKILKKYDINKLSTACKRSIIRIYWNFVDFYHEEGIRWVGDYQGLLGCIVEKVDNRCGVLDGKVFLFSYVQEEFVAIRNSVQILLELVYLQTPIQNFLKTFNFTQIFSKWLQKHSYNLFILFQLLLLFQNLLKPRTQQIYNNTIKTGLLIKISWIIFDLIQRVLNKNSWFQVGFVEQDQAHLLRVFNCYGEIVGLCFDWFQVRLGLDYGEEHEEIKRNIYQIMNSLREILIFDINSGFNHLPANSQILSTQSEPFEIRKNKMIKNISIKIKQGDNLLRLYQINSPQHKYQLTVKI